MKKLLILALVGLLVALAVRVWAWGIYFDQKQATRPHEFILAESNTVGIVHIKYDGDGWDDGLARKEAAAANLLKHFHTLFGAPVATNAVVMDVSTIAEAGIEKTGSLFLITGAGKIGMSDADTGKLREILLSGGTLLAIAGSPHWHNSFIRFSKKLFPDTQLRVIADDDAVMQTPYALQSGAPPLWHHGGYFTGGLKHEGRWVVIYHSGDLDDAWKTGHSGVGQDRAEGAYAFGVNVLCYAYQHYYQARRKHIPRVIRYNIAGNPVPPLPPLRRDAIKIPSHINPNAKILKILEHARREEIPKEPEIDLKKLDEETNPD